MQDQWSPYYQGQAPPQPSTSANISYEYNPSQQPQPQQSPNHMHQQQSQGMSSGPNIFQQMHQEQPTYLLPQIYTGDSAMSLSMRSAPSSSISSSVSSASGNISPTYMRTSMSSSTTGRTPSTPASSISLPSPFFVAKDPNPQESWFGSLQDSFLSSQQAPSYELQQSTSPAYYRMDRMSISSPIPSATEQPGSWNQTSMSPQQRTPRRASVAVFQTSPTHQTPTYQTHQPAYNPQALYQSPPQQPVQYTQSGQSWSQSSDTSAYQPNYGYQNAPLPSANSAGAVDMRASYGMSPNTGMGINLSQSYYPSQASWQSQPQSQPASQLPPMENYNFAGVLLDAEDLHLLGPDPLSPTSPAVQNTYRPTKPGWQPAFSFGTETTPKAVQQATMQPLPRQHGSISEVQPNWNFASFHGFTPLTGVATSQPLTERAASAPPPMEILPVQLPSSMLGEDMNRRRGSSVDSPSMLPFQLATFPHPALSPPRTSRPSYQSSPVYLGKGPARLGQSSIAARRATVGPSPLDLAKPSTQSSPLSQSASLDYTSLPPKSAPIPASIPSSPTRRKGNRRSMAPMFINFTTKDAKKLLSGVAPSGSSKRKREEEEARNQAKHVKFDETIKEDSEESIEGFPTDA